MQINIDKNAGFCFGVEDAISIAEKQLHDNGSLICLGDIVHNDEEVKRLQNEGIEFINKEKVKGCLND